MQSVCIHCILRDTYNKICHILNPGIHGINLALKYNEKRTFTTLLLHNNIALAFYVNILSVHMLLYRSVLHMHVCMYNIK